MAADLLVRSWSRAARAALLLGATAGLSCERSPAPAGAGGVAPAVAAWSNEVRSYALTEAARRSVARRGAPAQTGGTLVQAVARDYGTLNNLLRVSSNEEQLCRTFLFPPLLDLDPDTLELVPLIAAARPERSADGLTYTWKIRPGIRWHRGDAAGPVELTAADFEFSWRMLADPRVKAERARAALGPIADVQAIDRYSFRVIAAKPYFRLELEVGYNFRVMPAHLSAHEPEQFNVDPLGLAPVGYGPYRFKEWKAGEFLELERNPDWTLTERLPYPIERLRIRVVSDASLWSQLFARGELSLCAVNDPKRWEELKADPALQELASYHEYFLPQWLYISWNLRRPPFADARVRKALTHLYPRERVRDKLYAGHAVVLNAPGSVTYPAYDASRPPVPFDPAAAQALLDVAGWRDLDGDGIRERDGAPLRFTLRHPAATVEAIATGNRWFQEEARTAGVDVVVEPVDFEKLKEQLAAHDYDAVLLSWVGDPRDDDLFDRFHSDSIAAGSNYGGYADRECDALLDAYRSEYDEAARLALGRAIYAKLGEDLPVTPLYNPQALALASTRLRNVKVRRTGARWFDWWIAP